MDPVRKDVRRARWRRPALAVPALLLVLLSSACSRPATGGPGENAAGPTLGRRDALYDFVQLGKSELLAVGRFGRILRSSDLGQTWESVESGTERSLYSVSYADAKNGVIVGQAGSYLESGDGGRTWKIREFPAKNELFKVVFRSPNEGVVVGAFGTAWRTDSGGREWRPIGIPWETVLNEVWENVGPVEPHLYDVAFVGSDGWIVGEYGLVLRSRDGGSTWSRQRGGRLPDAHLFAAAFVDSRRGLAVGQSGVLLHTEDGGETWAEERVGSRSLYDVLFRPSQNEALAFGELGTILASRDGGRPGSWQVLPPLSLAEGGLNLWLSKALDIPARGLLVAGAGGIGWYDSTPAETIASEKTTSMGSADGKIL